MAVPLVLVVADDLTGGNATGARYARLGLRAVTVTPADEPSRNPRTARCAARADVLVLNTASRNLSPAQARSAVRAAVAAAPADARLLVKRVDTTLRGNPGAELDALLEVTAPRSPDEPRVLAVPAYPDAGRTTVGGIHLVDGVPLAESAAARGPFMPVRHSRVADVLRTQTSRRIVELPLTAVESGPAAVADALRGAPPGTVVVCDATADSDLRTLARAAAHLTAGEWGGTPPVVLDSGPFGAALADALMLTPPPAPGSRVLAVVASATDRTREQCAHARDTLGVEWVDVDPSTPGPDTALAALQAQAAAGATFLGVRVAPAALVPGAASAVLRCIAAVARRATDELAPGALYVSGGDAATAVLHALDADGFAVDGEVLPLAVTGSIVGGPYAGLRFATKGGLIGDAAATTACLDHLRAVTSRSTLPRGES